MLNCTPETAGERGLPGSEPRRAVVGLTVEQAQRTLPAPGGGLAVLETAALCEHSGGSGAQQQRSKALP